MNTPPRAIWLDTDIIFNRFAEDVDDGLALMLALASPRVVLRGISLMRGVDNGLAVTQRLLAHYARYPVPVYRGADDIFAGHGTRSEAVDQLAAALRRERLTIVAIGSATNLANLILFHPDVLERIDEIVFCAGRQQGVTFTAPGGRRIPLPDANFDNDTESTRLLLATAIPLTLVGFEASASIRLNGPDIGRIRHRGRKGDRWVARRLEWWRWVWRLGLRLPGFIPFDACTMGYLLCPELFQCHRDIPVAISRRANDAPRWKKDAEKDYLEVSYALPAIRRVDFAYQLDPQFKDILMAHLLGDNA
ncbi:MAG: nucleoside hydrolase [Oceanococcaceae bacterium]